MRVTRPYLHVALALGICASGATASAQVQSPADRAIPTERIGNQFIVSGMVGGTSGEELAENSVDFGGAFTYLWNGIVGAEFLTNISPDLQLSEPGVLDDSSLDTYMANAVVALPLGGVSNFDRRVWQPFFSGGIGAVNLRREVEDDVFNDLEDTQLGMNAGGGLMAFFNQWGFRVDLRYFMGLDDDDDADPADVLDPTSPLADLNFWRGGAGISYRW